MPQLQNKCLVQFAIWQACEQPQIEVLFPFATDDHPLEDPRAIPVRRKTRSSQGLAGRRVMTPIGFRQPGQAWRHAACTPSQDKNRKPPIIHGTIHYRKRQKIENMSAGSRTGVASPPATIEALVTIMSAICIAATDIFWINQCVLVIIVRLPANERSSPPRGGRQTKRVDVSPWLQLRPQSRRVTR